MIKYYEYQETYYKVTETAIEIVSIQSINTRIAKVSDSLVVSAIHKSIENQKWLEVGQIYYQQKRAEAYSLLET
jgi:hypothetical protein